MLQLSVDLFIIQNVPQALINFLVQNFVLLEQLQMVAFKSVSFQYQTIMLVLRLSHYALSIF